MRHEILINDHLGSIEPASMTGLYRERIDCSYIKKENRPV